MIFRRGPLPTRLENSATLVSCSECGDYDSGLSDRVPERDGKFARIGA